MRKRKNTIFSSFEKYIPKVIAYEIHEWIHNCLQIEEQVNTVHIDGIRRYVYIKFQTAQQADDFLQRISQPVYCKHANGERSVVRCSAAGLGIRYIQVADLPPEMEMKTVKNAVTKYGTIYGDINTDTDIDTE
jgi:hypothetical protein